MLTPEEARTLADICDVWPKRMGCILIPSVRGKHGYRAAEWGWAGRQGYGYKVPARGYPGDFDYTRIQAIFDEHPDALLCPVTQLGVLRGVQGFHGHMAVYKEIRAVVMQQLDMSEKQAQLEYNRLLKEDPTTLAHLFRTYAQCEEDAYELFVRIEQSGGFLRSMQEKEK